MVISLFATYLATLAVVYGISDLDLYDFEVSPQPKGFRIIGETDGDGAGVSVNSVGDVNNDGLPDIIFKVKNASLATGISYVLYGQISSFTFANINLEDFSSLPGQTTGFRIYGAGGDASLNSVAAAGDVNNDGIDDFVIGSPQDDVAFVIYGHDGNVVTQGDIELDQFVTSPETGFRIVVDNGVQGGFCVGSLGDINGDRIADLVVTDQRYQNYRGITYIIFGNYSHQGDIHTNTLTENGLGFRMTGENENDWFGYLAVDAGDVNSDGIDDFIISAPFADINIADPNTGVVGITYFMFGRNTSDAGVAPFTDINMGSFTSGATGYRIIGQSDNLRCGWAIAGLGDVNRDGYDDFAFTTWYDDITYVVFGVASWNYLDVALVDWDTTLSDFGLRLVGAGESVSSAGDVNGDGFPDILCAITWVGFIPDRDESGIVYVIYGKAWAFPYEDILLIDLVASVTMGFRIIGAETGHKLGYAVSSAGDFNDDGYDDMIVSTPTAYSGKGGVFIVFGEPITPTSQPSTQPSSQPTIQPTTQPSFLPTVQPSSQPSALPSGQPYSCPSSQPSIQPTARPSAQPSSQPSSQPSLQPSTRPLSQPSCQPSRQPSRQPSSQPTCQPTSQPISLPSLQPSAQPSRQPSCQPSVQPTVRPTNQPSIQPSTQPAAHPSTQPSRQPTSAPTKQPTAQPSHKPSLQPSRQPSAQPSGQPSSQPSAPPSSQPTDQPSVQPSARPSVQPTAYPTSQPSGQPLNQPSSQPSRCPTQQPSVQPTHQPSLQPINVPSTQPSTAPSSQPSSQPSAQPSRRPTRCPSSQPSVQPTSQPSRQPSGQPTHSPTGLQIITTGEWVLPLNTNLTVVNAGTAVGDNVWVCGGESSITCVVIDAKSGLLNTKYSLPWDEVVSVLATEDINTVAIGATSTRNGVVYSEIAVCDSSASLLCSVMEFSDTTFVAAVNVPYTSQNVFVGHHTGNPSVSVMEPSTEAEVGTVRHYAYTPSAVRSVKLTHITSVPNFAGVFIAGTGLESAATVPVIVAGWVSTSSGMLSAMYVTPVGSTLVSDADLVNVIAMADVGPDSFIAGGLQTTTSGSVTTAFLVRMNALYKTASFGVKYVSKSGANRRSVVKGMVSEGSVVYLLLSNEVLVRETQSSSSSSSSTSTSQGMVHRVIPKGNNGFSVLNSAVSTISRVVTILKVSAATGAVLQQMLLSIDTGNVSCAEITASQLSLSVTCAVQDSLDSTSSRVVIATHRDLSFKRLPAGWIRNSTISFTRQLTPFSATSFTAPTSSKVIPTSSYTYSTLGQTPTWRPTVAPTIALSSQPTVRPSVQPSGVPSGQPSSSPTSAPSISPQPTSHPSTGGPTNTYKPTVKPTLHPSASPSLPPTVKPSVSPSVVPSTGPSVLPSTDPSTTPTFLPTLSPTEDPTLRPTRSPTVRPSRAFTTVAPSAADSNGNVDDSVLPISESGGKQGGLTTEAIVIAVSAAGGAIGFGCLALLVCAACSYKLRKNRKKYVERRKTLHPSNDIHAMTLEARRIETLKVLNENLKSASKTTAQVATQRTITSDSVTAARAVRAAVPPDESDAQSADANSLSDSSLEMSSLHSSEISDTEYYFTGVVKGSKPTRSVRRLSEMEAQRVLSTDESNIESKGIDLDDDSSIERGFNEIMAEFSDESSWDGSHL